MSTKKTTDQQNENVKKEHNPEIGPNKIVEIKLSWTELAPKYQEVIKKAAKQVKLDGFRPGKVPVEIAESRLDAEAVAKQTLDGILPDKYVKIIEEKKLKTVANPEFVLKKIDKGEDWELEAHIALAPEIKLPKDYQKFLATAKKKALAEIEKREKDIAQASKNEAKKTKKEIPAGDETNPISKLTDEQKASQALDKALLDLRAEIKPVISELLVKMQAQKRFQELVGQLEQMGLKLDDYLEKTGTDFDQFAAQVTAEALQTVQLDFILREILTTEKIEASEAEIDAELDKLLAPTPEKMGEAEKKMMVEQKKNPDYRKYAAGMVQQHKLVDFLKNL